ncbi:PKD domain-containing protein [Nitrosopumilus sp.]|uniref:PKD domain-containing protein n=1 Tax=Nitrosopumilus sp. TaxID=2024843 RepID=UPI00247C10C7|nr:PKD domain-containing protein [Nitrosopumilus sp.]MCV0431212.1 PKD domain-containing protein [Nitrosopumilus sp.]
MFGRGLVLGLLFTVLLIGFSFSQESFAAAGDPIVDAGPGAIIDEGDTFSHVGSFTLPDAENNWTATVDYGSGVGEEPLSLNFGAGTFSLDHLYNMHAPFQLTVEITNGTHTGTDVITIDVQNVSPVIDNPIPDVTLDEGDTFFYSGTFTDPGFDAFTGTVTYGNFGIGNLTLAMGASTFDLERTFVTDGIFDSIVVISDDAENSNSTATFTITVNNVSPTLSLGSGGTINQGDTFLSSGSFIDPGEDPWIITADFGDGTAPVDVSFSDTKTFDLSHTFKKSGIFTVTVSVDDGTDIVTDTLSVTVNNVAPIVDAGPDDIIDEGEEFTSMGSFSDPGDESLTITIDYGDGESEIIPESIDGNFDINHVYDNDGSFTVEVTVDDGTTTVIDSAIVTVNNVLPEITLDSKSVDENRLFTGSGSFVDPGDDMWTATIDYGDGSSSEPLLLSGMTFSLSNTYSTNGVYDASITISDDDGSTVSTFMIGVFVSDTTLPSDLNSPMFTSQISTDSATFSTSNQDIWGPVTGGSGTSSWNLFNPQRWNESDGDSSYVTLAGKRLGGGISAGTSGHLELIGSASDLSGKIGVNYPGSIKVTHPDADSFLAGQSVPVSSDWTLASSAKILAGKTMGDLRMDFDIGLAEFVDTDVCLLVGCVDLFVIPDIDIDTGKTKLFSISDAGDLDMPSALTGFVGLTGNFNPISVQPATTSVNPSTGRIIAEHTNKFSDINIDLDKVATRLGVAPPLGIDKEISSVKLVANLFDVDADIDFKAHQKLTFDSDVLIKLDFSRPVTGVVGSILDLTTSGDKVSSVTYRQGEEIKIIFPIGETDPITVTPTALLDSSKTKLHQFTEVITESDVNMFSLDAGIALPSFTVVPAIPIYNPVPHFSNWQCHERVLGVCVWAGYTHGPHWHKIGETPAVKFNGVDVGVGPVWNSGPQGQEIKKDILANKAFALGGFNTVALSPFELNPEVPPTAEAGGPYEVLEGSVVQLLGTGEDLDGDPITFAWDFDGDMTYETSGAIVDYPLGIDGPDTLSAELQVCDDLNCDEDFATITVINVAPTLEAGDDETIDEGSLFTRTINFEDPGADTWDIEIDYGNGFTESLSALTERTFDLNHTYADNGDYTISIMVTDDDAGTDSDSFVVTVNNVNPTTEAGDPDSVDEGTLYSYVATFTDPGFDCDTCGTLEDFTATVDWGDNTGVESLAVDETPGSPGVLTQGTASGSHTFADNGIYTVTVTVTDDDTGVGIDIFDITVNNVNPTVEAGIDQEAVIHDLVSLDPSTFTDPGFDCALCNTLEDFTSIVNWGEGSDEPLIVDETPGSPGVLTQGTASGDHIYRLPGDYTVTVTVDDDDAGTHSDSLITTVLGAQDLKNRAISFLSPYNSEKDVKKAIESINDSLDSKFWLSDVYLDEKYGKKVFDEEKKAVKDLQKILKDGAKKGIDPTFAEITQDSIDLLVNADRVLTITIMLDATSTPADDPKKQDKVDKENEKSAEEFAKADEYRDEGDYDKAIDHYKKAWEHSLAALKHANK